VGVRNRWKGHARPWDAPRHFVATGPYRWVRNPIYSAAMLVLLGEAWLFLSLPLLVYAVLAAIGCHLFVVVYEEPTLRKRFGVEYGMSGAGFHTRLNRRLRRREVPGLPTEN
jgi:protein-S-isoprenylcysteine O-methyltransferase Ste14